MIWILRRRVELMNYFPTLLSVGLGLRCQYGERLTVRIDWGIPLIQLELGDRSLQEQGIYFLVNWSPF